MSKLLQKAFAEASKLSEEEQDYLASQILEELADEDEFDQKIASTAHLLAGAAREAIAEHRAGLTEELDPEKL
jgi:hypothetical protein